MLHRLVTALMVSCCVLGCNQKAKPAKSSEKPAKVEAHPNETDIFRIVLTPKAEERLQISTTPIVRKSVPQSRLLGGDVIIPDGRRILVTAPLTGTLTQVEDTKPVTAGQQVNATQPLFRLSPMLPPEQEVPGAAERVQMANAKATLVSAQIQADGDAKQESSRVEAAQIALTRAQKLVNDKAGSQRDLDNAIATLDLARKAQEAAQQRKELLDELTLEVQTNNAATMTVRAPQSGVLQTVSARVGQVVSAGATLFEIADLSRLWIRVPVYSGQLNEIEMSADAVVSRLSDDGKGIVARPVTAPPTADPLSAAIDLYYEIDNATVNLRPGERVTAQLPMKGEADSLVVPRAAVLYDIHGTTWVYVNSAEHEFRRERVSIRFTTEELAVLDFGPEVGTPVVVDGAAELFGTEFGAGK